MKNLLLLVLIILIYSFPVFSSSHSTILLLTEKNGILITNNNGSTWKDYNNGLPQNIIPIKIYESFGNLYLTSQKSGIFFLKKNTDQWKNLSTDDFFVRSQYYKNKEYRKISAFAIDNSNPDHLVIATKHTIYKSNDSGICWEKIPINGINKRNYITALAVKGNDLYVGTSFNGIYKLNKDHFVNINKGLPKEPYSENLFFSEEIISISIDPDDSNTVLSGTAFGGGAYISKNKGKSWESLNIPVKKSTFAPINTAVSYKNNRYVSSYNKLYTYNEKNPEWIQSDNSEFMNNIPKKVKASAFFSYDKEKERPSIFYSIENKNKILEKANNKKAIYSSIPSIRKKLNNLISTIKNCQLNAIVIDMKDDFGNIYYPTENVTAKEIGAKRKPLDINIILEKLKKNDIYTIARIVVFKDEKLFNAYNNKYAIYNKATGAAWKGTEKEYWVDPHSEYVHTYNISLAVELEKLGFDEIQFDYIRFPSDGNLFLCNYKYQQDPDTYKSEALMDFLKKAKESLKIPVSVDIYGFISWYSSGNCIGQNIEEFSYVVDAICPMVYPSHFGRKFYIHVDRETRPYKIIYDGGVRAITLSKPVAIRPYLQAFNLLSPTWGPGYILNQIKGAEDSKCSGFTFWNANGDYEMLKKSLIKK